MTALWVSLLANVVGMAVLVFLVYFRRHYRRDLALAYVALSMGIFAVTLLLSESEAGLGLGLGLFGILSIIRLRSDTLTQEEVAYYFISLAIGLINGLHPDPAWISPVITASLVAIMYVVDHHGVGRNTQRQMVTLDRAYPAEHQQVDALEQLLDAKVLHTVVLELDMVRDLTIVDVRYSPNGPVDNIPAPKKQRNSLFNIRASNSARQPISVEQSTYGLAQGPARVSTNRVG